MCACSPESHPYPGLQPQQRGQQGEGGDSAPLLHSHETPPGVTQNHRMVGVGRDLCGSSSPTLLPKQGHLQ